MLVCPSCQFAIDDAARAEGRCPACGAALRPLSHRTIADVRQSKPHPGDEQANDKTLELPAGGLLGQSVDLTLLPDDDSRSSNPTLPELPPAPADGAAPPEPKHATVAFGPEQTIEFTGSASNIDESMLTSQWEGGLPANARDVGVTIKQKETITGTYVSSSSLIVKSRHVRPTGKPDAPLASPADAPDYELLNVIGEGGMGVVYAARQSSIARTVALKMLKGQEADAAQRDKFISEAVVTGELDHPNIVPIYDLGANDDGALFYSMKRVKGTPWHKVLKHKTLDENLNILLRVADAVAFAHVNGVIHRDLKPENVMLGDFGEVLVMDWGLARVTSEFPNAASVTQSEAMGGTPAYMAPEMATGPLERITPASDVYLLGAILYEIITGKPPHSGKTVMACLFAAAKNQIVPTDKSGELVDIALRAMAAAPEQRHASVQEFQEAVREYQAHAESLRLLRHAGDNLERAADAQDYDLYARAIYALEESLALWPGNRKAAELLDAARLDYARLAIAKGDFDLGASLLDGSNEAHRAVLALADEGRLERQSRQRRIRLLKRAVAALVAAVIAIVSTAYVAVSRQRDEAVAQRREAERQRGLADEARDEAERQEQSARAGWAEAERNFAAADRARAAEMEQREVADQKRLEAEEQRALAVAAQQAEAYAAYVARIGLAKAKLDENSFDRAAELLDECPPELRNWEWGRLRLLTQLAEASWRAPAPLDAVAVSPDGVHAATGGWDGQAAIWNLTTGRREHQLRQGEYVHAVAYDAEGQRLAAGSSNGAIRVYRAADGQPLLELPGHSGGVLSVRFAPDGRRLLSAGYDNAARLWDLETGQLLQTLQRHTWWVWAAEFSSDGRRILTAGQDGQAIVWQRAADDRPYEPFTQFAQHRGPVYAARFAPGDDEVATAGFDGRVLLWRPDEVEPIDVDRRIQGEPDPPAPFRTLRAHRGPVRALAYSRDGAHLASGGQDNVAIVWDLASGAAWRELRGHASHVRGCDFTPDGQQLLTAGRDAQLKLWRPAAYGELRVIDADREAGFATLAARFSPDGAQVVTASSDRSASLWDAQTLERRQVFDEGHEFLATAAAFFADGSRLATGAGDGTVRLWNASTGGQILSIDDAGRRGALAVSPDGRRVAAGRSGGSGDVQIVDAATGEVVAELVGHPAEATALRFAPAGRQLATGDANGHIRLWNYDPVAAQWSAGHRLEGHSRTITALAYVDDGRRLISASGDNTCGQWDVATGREQTDRVLKHPGWVADMAAAPDGRQAVTVCDDGKVRLWDLAEAREARQFVTRGDRSAFTSVDISPDGRLAAAACLAEGTVRVWDLVAGDELTAPSGGAWLEAGVRSGVINARFAPNDPHLLVIGGNDARLMDIESRALVRRFSPPGVVASVDVSQDGARVVTGSWDRTARVWDAAAGRVLVKLDGVHEGYVNSVAFSPDDRLVLTASDDGTARLWHAVDGTPTGVAFTGHNQRVRQACFSPDGQNVLSVGNDKLARLWDAATGAEVAQFAGHEWAVLCGGFSGDGRRIITGGEDNRAIVWDAATGERLATLAGHTAAVTAVALSPDGSRALTGSEDNAVKLWDAATGEDILTLVGHDDVVTDVSFAPDGLGALTSGRDGRTLLWPAAPWRTPADLSWRSGK